MARVADGGARASERLTRSLDAGLAERTAVNRAFFQAESERLARLCHRMAERFDRSGRLVAFGRTPGARSDVRHVAVEFVHPVIVGKRALPALGIPADYVGLTVEADDIAVAFGDDVAEAVGVARERGCLTVAFASVGAEWEFAPAVADPSIRQELVETLYHVLWELVHVFFDHLRVNTRGAGASSFLYPFLGERSDDLDAVVEDVRQSILLKADEVAALRAQTLTDNREELLAAAAGLRRDLDDGGQVLALGNGGSATDAMDVVADFRADGRRAIDLTEDPAILTAIANDIGTEAIFARQVIAYGRPGDALLALSTSGNSANVIAALAEARRRGLRTIALVGYDGGRVAAERLADHVVVTRSQHIPRIQEAQASAYHLLGELVELAATS
jgi:D-sedoheptulose 7-phosphate isomerase